MLGEFVDLQREERGGGDDRQVLRPALGVPEADRLDEFDQGVGQEEGGDHHQGGVFVAEGVLDGADHG